jgi:hypothetical protein
MVKQEHCMRFRGCFVQIILFVCILLLLEGLADGQESNAKTHAPNPDRIVVILWDVGGGNFFVPNAEIRVEVFGTNAAEIKLVSANSDGATTELQSFTCRDGSRINFSTKYSRLQTQTLEIRLYDSKGNLLTFTKRKVS